ncbi:MAG: cupin domain-containing protein [Chloroflexi bacterium]|nr:cupin domain-containing protein [Chloroflexota bacterium]
MQGRAPVSGPRTIYEQWMEKEGIPNYQAEAGVEDVTKLPRGPWARLGGLGTFIELEGTKQARKLLYVAEIPAGGALEPEKHLYDELICVLQGRGLAEVWHEGQGKVAFEWGKGSLFAIPLNAWHRFVNGSREPVLLFAVTSAPLVMNTLRNLEFIFNCDYKFTDRFTGKADYFVVGEKQYKDWSGHNERDTNFVPDLLSVSMRPQPEKAEDQVSDGFNMASWRGTAAGEWPAGKYHKAHYHGPGAILLGLRSEGYAILWPRQFGIHPYQDGHGDKVITVNWKVHGIYSPQTEWFHQHFNIGTEPARHLRVTGGGIGIELPTLSKEVPTTLRDGVPVATYASIRDGGRVIEYEDEDPAIRRGFEEILRQKGLKSAMKPVVYRTDPFREPR